MRARAWRRSESRGKRNIASLPPYRDNAVGSCQCHSAFLSIRFIPTPSKLKGSEMENKIKTFTEEETAELQKKSKERTVRTQNVEYDIGTLVNKINSNLIKLDPEYQRNHRWDDIKSSRLIESLILNIPIPIIYISYDIDVDEEVSSEQVRYSVIDGQQRLRAISDYFNNKYILEGLDTLSEVNGLKFRELPGFLQRRLEARTVRCLQVDSTIDEQVKYDIFERLNIGAVKLEAQEIRNATIRGKVNKKLKELSLNRDFNALLQIEDSSKREENIRVRKMEDRELVLRFLALYNNYSDESISKGMGNYLTEKMKYLNSISDSDLDIIAQAFVDVMKTTREYFGKTAFAKLKYKDGRRLFASKFNVAVYDALSQAILYNLLKGKKTYTKKEVERFEKLFQDSEFISAISSAINDRSKLRLRIERAIEAISQ